MTPEEELAALEKRAIAYREDPADQALVAAALERIRKRREANK